MRLAYFDCFSGISGDMVLGALVDAGLDPEALRQELAKLPVPGIDVTFSPASRLGIAGTAAQVSVNRSPVETDHIHLHSHGESHPHRHLDEILQAIRSSSLDAEVRATAELIYCRLAGAEAEVHGLPPEEVHLHEVGAADAIVDIVGSVVGLRLLGVQQVFASPLRFGTGYVQCAHGRYPVPVPGVLALCKDVPTEQTDVRAELVTPTGAAIITTLAQGYGPVPPMRIDSLGYGAGKRELPEVPNLLRVRLGESTEQLTRDRVVLLEANIDDMNPEIYGYLSDLLFERGALDVYITPAQMKKGRPGNVLSVLTQPRDQEQIAATILAETTTLGVRHQAVDRLVLQRAIASVDTPYGPVQVKVWDFDGVRRSAPEYEDCAQLARRHGVPIQSVYAAARAADGEQSNRGNP